MSLISTADDWREPPTPKNEAATREESEIRRRIAAGEIKSSDLSVKERELYRQELQRQFRRY